MVIRYAMHGSGHIAREVATFNEPIRDALRNVPETAAPSHVRVHEPVPEAAELPGLQLAPGSSYLLAWRDGDWRLAESWPHPARR